MDYKELLESLRELIDPDFVKVDLNHISTLDFGNYSSKIILSVVGLEESSSHRNQVSFSRQGANNPLETVLPNLELKLLFASYSGNQQDYLQGIQNLNEIRTYFFTHPMVEFSGQKVKIELVHLNFE